MNIDAKNMETLHVLEELQEHGRGIFKLPSRKGKHDWPVSKFERPSECPYCEHELKEGHEWLFPPRCSYWFCLKCKSVFMERHNEPAHIKYIGQKKDHESECTYRSYVRGYVSQIDSQGNEIEGSRTYP